MPNLAPGVEVSQQSFNAFSSLTSEKQVESYGFGVDTPVQVGQDWLYTMRVGDMSRLGWDGYLSSMLQMKAFCDEKLAENPQSRVHSVFLLEENYSLPQKNTIWYAYTSLSFAPYMTAINKGSINVVGLKASFRKSIKHDFTREIAVDTTEFLFGALGRSSRFKITEASSQEEVIERILADQNKKQQEDDDLRAKGLVISSFED